MRTMLATAAGVVTNCEDTLRCFEAYAREEGLLMPPSIVAWPGTHRLPETSSELPHEACFIMVGTIEGRKNHKLLLSVWQDLVSEVQSATVPRAVPRLVIVGRRGWQADDVLRLLDHHDFNGHVTEVGPLPDAQMARLLMDARALLFPSWAEGFGMPLVEALAAGVPVIASDLPVFREVGQGVPDLLPVSDKAAWRDAILDYAHPCSEARADQIARMTRFRAPSWAEHFAQIDGLISALRK
jgi:glycosyltransferase involved in cell wall biosynthesis